VLEGFGLGRGVLWVGSGAVTMVGVVQEEERQRGGVLGAFLFFPPLLTARVGAEGAGLDRGVIQEYGYCNNSEIVTQVLINKVPNFGPK
jgi:hypothetical protein